MALKFLGKMKDFGLLVARLGLGVAFIIHGSGKMFGGPQAWTELGQTMGLFGLQLFPIAWGFAAAFSEFVGGFLLVLGFLFRPAALLLLGTMVVASYSLYTKGLGFVEVSHPLKMAFVFFGLLFVGPGKFSIDRE
jgi:putative oxidoreductase